MVWSYVFYVCFARRFWADMLCALLMHAYLTFFVQPMVYGRSVHFGIFLARVVQQIILTVAAHCLISTCGLFYSELVVMRQKNETLLNSLNEGVLVLLSGDDEALFANKAAKSLRVTSRQQPEESSREQVAGAHFDRSAKRFVKIEINLLMGDDTKEAS